MRKYGATLQSAAATADDSQAQYTTDTKVSSCCEASTVMFTSIFHWFNML
jgi:hypothetical protein